MANTPASRKVQRYEQFSKAQRTIEHEHAKIHDGNAYTLSIQSSLTSAGSFTLLLRTPANYFPHYRVVRSRFEDGPVLVKFYKGVGVNVASLGTEVVPVNMNGASTNTSSLAMYINPSIVDVNSLGTAIEQELVPSTGVQGGAQDSPTPFEWLLDESTDYAVVIENQTGNTQFTYTNFHYETSQTS